jgi:hypothetical protein
MVATPKLQKATELLAHPALQGCISIASLLITLMRAILGS